MEVYDITRRALRYLESRGILMDDVGHGCGDYLLVVCPARFAESPRSIRVLERYKDESSAMYCADARQTFSEDNAQCTNLHYVLCYEVWHVVKDYKPRPTHDVEHVNDCGKKPSRHVSVKFDEKEPETVTPPTITDEDWKELDRIFPPMYKVKRLCVLSVGFASTPESWETHIDHCYAFVADGIDFLYSKISHPLSGGYPFYEFTWTVADDVDFSALAGFMSKMAKLGCMIEFGWRNVEVAR